MPNQVNYYEMIGFQSATPCPSSDLPETPDLSHTAIFLDFDGTLTEIAPRPDEISIDPALPRILNDLARATDGALAVVSGRRLADLEHYLPGFRGVLVGCHGAERRIGGTYERIDECDCETLEGFRDVVRAWVRHKEKVLLEEKPASVVLHFRQAPEAMTEGEHFLNSLVEGLDGWTVHHAKMALELIPSRVSKGGAVTELLSHMPDRTPIAIGDDTTDETMFAVATQNGGYGIRVGDGDTHAKHCIASVETLRRMLESWVRDPRGVKCPNA
ncbi:trehalose 6-phosphatase [Tranquillimonas rosea]|uniref:Trehalose 6-phosphate phosphatase n=1 Tax=Tranquillimonas rosea TaxID=641238 RepID=A0A1H9WRE8_9RHOB|nr:trehalose-phosphatase [Tranquillimonas rosea]SES36381.1 trehalose 6-phosphatase [Tranquillimonas rosea]